jgi:uncharacterized RDD family membrane protein YckC
MDDYKEVNEIASLRTIFGIKRVVVLPEYYGTMDIRLLAVMIDYVIVGMGAAIPALMLMILTPEKMGMILIAVLYFLTLPVVKLFYAAVMESSPKQGTYGKNWLGLAVCDEEGARLTAGKAWLRNFAKIFSVLPLGMGYIAGFFNRRQQTFHDRIAGTLVIKLRLV